MIPNLTQEGLLPAGLHDCSLQAISAVFCGGLHRASLFANLKLCLKHMRANQLDGTVVVNGSFVTDKILPGDIELTLDTRHLSDTEQLKALKYFYAFHQQHFDDWKIDWYPTIAGMKASDFVRFFQYVGVKTAAIKNIPADGPKGILRLENW